MWVWQLFAILDRPASVMESTFHRGRALRDDLGVSDGGDLGVLVFLGTHGVGRDRYQSGVWAIRPISLMGIFSSLTGGDHTHMAQRGSAHIFEQTILVVNSRSAPA